MNPRDTALLLAAVVGVAYGFMQARRQVDPWFPFDPTFGCPGSLGHCGRGPLPYFDPFTRGSTLGPQTWATAYPGAAVNQAFQQYADDVSSPRLQAGAHYYDAMMNRNIGNLWKS